LYRCSAVRTGSRNFEYWTLDVDWVAPSVEAFYTSRR
jgi:hypothetical protein